ncbi:Localization factor PodJL [compost metagenome]
MEQAVSWYRKAAEQGLSEAQTDLGLAYATGKGVPQDHAQAYIWLSVAIANGASQTDDTRDTLATKLSPEQLQRAQATAGQFFEMYRPPN